MSVMSNNGLSNNGVNDVGTSSEGLSPGRCPVAQQRGPGRQPMTASRTTKMIGAKKQTELLWNVI